MKSTNFRRSAIFLLLGCFLFAHDISAQNAVPNNFKSLVIVGSGKTSIAALARPRIFAAAAAADAKDDTPGKPTVTLAGKSVNIFELERRAFDLVNVKRIQAGLTALVWNEKLTRIARLHSENMAAYNYFSHTGLDGKMVNNRADDAGVNHWRAVGENIAYNRGFGDPTLCAVEKWMMSPGHRDNILKSNWKEAGVGVAVTAKGTYYFTQVFLVK